MNEEKAKELALITSYIIRYDAFNGTVMQTFDESYKLAEMFLIEYPIDTLWGEEEGLEWDETLEKFIESKTVNGRWK